MMKKIFDVLFHGRRPSEVPLMPEQSEPRPRPRPLSTASLGSRRFSRPVSMVSSVIPEEGCDDDDYPRPNLRAHMNSSITAIPEGNEKFVRPQPSITINTEAAESSRDLESNQEAEFSRMQVIGEIFKEYWMEDIDPKKAVVPLSAYCFMTGFMDAVCFSAIFVWCAFQTGNSVQLSLALARLFNGTHDYTFQLADQQALCSVLTFLFGSFLGRIGDKVGFKTRMWMTVGTLIQTLFTMAAALTLWKSRSGSFTDTRDDPAWTDALTFVTIGFMSASMGLQAIMAKRLNTHFTTTVVLTTTWSELMAEPELFNWRRHVRSRDYKAMAILFLFLGGFTSRAILDKIGSPATLGIGTGLRLITTLWWLWVPAKKAK